MQDSQDNYNPELPQDQRQSSKSLLGLRETRFSSSNRFYQHQPKRRSNMEYNHVAEAPMDGKFQRLSKIIAHSSYCARRKAEKMILDGRVTIDGQVITDVACKVDVSNPEVLKNKVLLDGQPFLESLEPETKLWIFYKPKGCLVTKQDSEGRKTIYDYLPEDMQKIIAIGRLDYNTSGLMLLTNCGGLANYISSPKNAWSRVYKVRVFGNLNREKLQSAEQGIMLKNEHYVAQKIEVEEEGEGSNSWLIVTMQEGKNREVRKIMQYCGLQVTKLYRISFGQFNLEGMEPGEFREISQSVVEELMKKSR